MTFIPSSKSLTASRPNVTRSPFGRMYRATWSLGGVERSEAERREDPTDVAWITASTSQADRLSAPSVDNYVIFNGWHSVDCKWFGCHFGQSADNYYTRLVCLPCRFFTATSAGGQFTDLWRPRRHVPQSRPSSVVVSTTATLFWPGSLMFIFSDSSLCRMRQPAWSPGLVVTTTSRRFLLAYTGFQYASESATRRRCLCGSVYTMQPLATCLTCVCRLTPCVVASNCVPRRRTPDTTLCSFKRHLKAHRFQQ